MKIVKNSGSKFWQLFKAGKHTSRAGSEFSATSETIDEIIQATKSRAYANDEVPIVIGHPKENSPQFGAFKKDAFKNVDGVLCGKFEYLTPEFAECVEKKMYNKISIALYKDKALRHIGFFGSLQTALKDLAPVELAAADEETIELEFSAEEFAEFEVSRHPFNIITMLFRNIKNMLIADKGLEEAEKLMPESSLSEVSNPPYIWQKSSDRYFSENDNHSNKNPEGKKMDKTIEELQKEANEFSEKLNASETEKKKLADENARLKAQQLESEIVQFCEGPEMRKKITPALLPHVKQLYTDLAAVNDEFEFSEGDQKVKSTRVDAFKKVLAALPDAVEFSETAKKDKAAGDKEDNNDAQDIAKRALEFQEAEAKAGRTISISQAVAEVTK